jgi:anti-sigma regulatory factor (Ser/Thr protein kinase)
MGADDSESGLHAGAVVPSRADSVPATRAFLIRLLQGWSVTEDVVESAALLTTEIMANALEHGAGLVSVGISLDEGLLHIGVGDKAKERQPEVRALDSESDSGRGMWIVDILARNWGYDPAPGGVGKTVWFELSSAAPQPVGPG